MVKVQTCRTKITSKPHLWDYKRCWICAFEKHAHDHKPDLRCRDVPFGKLWVTCSLEEWWTTIRISAPLNKVSLSCGWKVIKMLFLKPGSSSRYISQAYDLAKQAPLCIQKSSARSQSSSRWRLSGLCTKDFEVEGETRSRSFIAFFYKSTDLIILRLRHLPDVTDILWYLRDPLSM